MGEPVQLVARRAEQVLGRGQQVEPGTCGHAGTLPGDGGGQVGEPGGDIRLVQGLGQVGAVTGVGEREAGVQVSV